MKHALYPLSFASLVLCGAIFGFFYAWFCSVMWGLDAAAPSVAIAAMQAMNAAVRNAAFAPAFFGTPLVLLITAFVASKSGRRTASLAFLLAAIVYLGGAFFPTAMVNVPMNEALAEIRTSEVAGSVDTVWKNYSGTWQFWNGVRTIASAICLMLTGAAFMFLRGTKIEPANSRL